MATFEKKKSIEKSVSVPVLNTSPTLYQRYKVNKEEGDMGFELDMIKFLENYKRDVELYNSYGLNEKEKRKEKKEE